MRASETDRGVVCPASLFTIKSHRDRSENADKAAAFGTLVHFWKETGDPIMPGASAKDQVCLEKKLLLSDIRREDWWVGGQHEVTFALNLESLSPIRYPQRAGRDEWKAAFPPDKWLTGTIDYLYDDGNGDDLKTGRWPVDAHTSRQLKSYALLPWVEAGCPSGWEKAWSITQWERYPLAGLPKRTATMLTSFDLRDHLEDLRWAAAHPDEVNPTEEGCKFCDCKPNCEAWN